MSYRFDDATNDNIDYGDVTFLDGLTTLSFHGWVLLDDVAADHYILSKFVGGVGGVLFLFDDVASVSGRTDTFTILIGDTTTVRVEGATNAATTFTWIPVGFSVDFGTGGVLNLWINGAKDANSGVSASAVGSFPNNTGSYRLGISQTTTLGMDGAMTNFAWWNRVLSDGEFAALSKVSPLNFPNGLVSYKNLIRSTSDLVTGGSGSVSGATVATEPVIIRPSAQILQFPPTAAGSVTGSVPDSLTITDTTTNTATIVALASDTLALSDTSSVVGTFVGTVSDSIVVTDEATGDLAGAITGAVPDAMSFTDTAAVTVNFVATASDSLGLTDTSSNTANRVAASDDSLALTDLIDLTQALNVAVNDLLSITETLTGGEVGEKVYCAYYTFLSSAETAVIAELNADDLIREAGLTDELAAYGFMSDSDTVRIAAISAADTVVAATLLC